ncbi:MAG TPA: ComEC/Rec2 family competence protein, partial [Chthoniobacterales bacterium]|nr:ComEC/Rec2 family competence protein [Chthoniobacterales bacterium]
MRVDIEGRGAWARQPFVGLALAALGGILVAESAPRWQTGLTLTLAFAALGLFTRRSPVTYLFGAACFFVIHSLQLTESPGVRLARQLGSEKHAISARGIVVSEPRVSARGTASFHFRVSAIEREGNSEAANATILARWRGEVRYGDELQLFGVIQSTEPPRNPGEFDMRAYLKRRDVHNELIARYPESG